MDKAVSAALEEPAAEEVSTELAADEAGPRAEYTRRREERRASAAARMRLFRKVGVARLVSAAALLALGWLAFKGLSAWWLLAPAAAFAALAAAQQRITRERRRCERAADFYGQGLDRLDDRWAGRGATGARFLDDAHPYAADLDLFGRASLFELLSTARTRAGEETLARWLLAPARPDVIRARQLAVAELRPLLDLREDLALLGEGVPTGDEARPLAAWASARAWQELTLPRVAAAALALLAVVTLGLWVAAGAGPIPFLAAFAAGWLYVRRQGERIEQVLGGVDGAGRDLALIAGVLARVERERFTSPLLSELRRALDAEGRAPSRQIARLNLLIDLLDARRNMMFAPLALVLHWPLQMALALERWRRDCGPAVARWLDAVGEFEALNSLAGYSYERPGDPFPEIAGGGARFEAESMGHPLIPASRNVRTDLSLTGEPGVLVVSGSNMSGKSTLLRTVGTNAVLALAGAPVRAARLRLTPLQIGASIRIQDSLQAGASRFYAEITRLRQIVGLTGGPLPVLFLLDEILHGTNSHDRRIGAEGVVRGLVERGAIGLVTTHDLALARIADELAARAANVHFEDQMEGGRMTFDYRLRPGVVRRSNALELMRSVGLDV